MYLRKAIVLLAVACAPAAGALGEMVVNGDFSGSEWMNAAGFNVDVESSKDTPGWFHAVDSGRVSVLPTGGNPDDFAAFQNPYSPRRAIQFIADGKQSTGDLTLSFDVAVGPVKTGTGWEVAVYGFAADQTGTFLMETRGDVPAGVATLLDVGETATAPFDWTSKSYTVPVGATGYDYLAVRITGTKGSGTAPGVGFDNVSLVPEPGTMLLLGLGGLAVIRRKR